MLSGLGPGQFAIMLECSDWLQHEAEVWSDVSMWKLASEARISIWQSDAELWIKPRFQVKPRIKSSINRKLCIMLGLIQKKKSPTAAWCYCGKIPTGSALTELNIQVGMKNLRFSTNIWLCLQNENVARCRDCVTSFVMCSWHTH